MPYSPLTWVDGVTGLDAVNFNNMEQGIDLVTEDVEKRVGALARTMAVSLDTLVESGWFTIPAGTANAPIAQKGFLKVEKPNDSWVRQIFYQYDVAAPGPNYIRVYNPTPGTWTAWAQAVAGADLSYDGDWVAGTYQDGDVVVKDGVAFICVGGPTAVAPDVSIWGSVGSPPAPANVVPIGATVMWPSASAVPTGWMKCDGSAIPGALTAAIAVLGTNVPDMRGRAPFGVDTGLALNANDAKASGSRGPSHKHTVVQPTISTPAINFTNPTVNSHTHGGGTNPTGTGNVGDNFPVWQRAGYTIDSGQRYPTDPAAPGTSGGAAALASAPIASGGTVGNQASALVDIIGYLGLHFIVYVGT